MGARKPRTLEAEALWDYALRVVGGRAQSTGELRAKLRLRAQRAADVDEVIGRMKDRGYLDDRRFAESFTAGRIENQGFGRSRVLRDLRARRVAPAVAEQVVRKAYEDVDEPRLIEDFLSRKYRKIPLKEFLAEPKNLAAAYRRLRLAGFSSGNVIRALKRYANEADELEAMEAPEGEERSL